MDQYLLYLAIASATIASPGPGVVLTITNSLSYGFWAAFPSILGVATGMMCIAAISATGLALVLATSALAFTVFKLVGAAYLIYLGIKMWRTSAKINVQKTAKAKTAKVRFTEGLLITLLNPKPIFFFMALFPQFITPNENYPAQFIFLTVTFSLLVVLIHCGYAAFSKLARSVLSTPKGRKLLGRVSGCFYMLFGLGLAASNR